MIYTLTAQAEKEPDGLKVTAGTRGFSITMDEPMEDGGTNAGMNPVEVALCALGACQSIYVALSAEKHRVNLKGFRVELEGDMDPHGENAGNVPRPGLQEIRYRMKFRTDADPADVERLAAHVASSCPMCCTMANPVRLVRSGIDIE